MKSSKNKLFDTLSCDITMEFSQYTNKSPLQSTYLFTCINALLNPYSRFIFNGIFMNMVNKKQLGMKR